MKNPQAVANCDVSGGVADGITTPSHSRCRVYRTWRPAPRLCSTERLAIECPAAGPPFIIVAVVAD